MFYALPHGFRPLSISVYAILYILVALALFGGFSRVALIEHAKLEKDTQQRNLALAKEEIVFTVTEIINKTENLAKQFSLWEETIQQFSNSTYYSYWLDNRVPTASFIPEYFLAIALYNSNGVAISTTRNRDLPERIMFEYEKLYIIKQNGGDNLFYYYPITDNIIKQKIIGYIGVKIDFLKAIKTIQRFKYVDLSSVAFNAISGAPVSKDQFFNLLEYKVIPNIEFDKLRDLLFSTLIRFALIGIGLAGLFLFLLVVLFGIPSRQLSRQIDSLRDNKLNLYKDYSEKRLPVAEFEKVRLSLNDYQIQLNHRDAALRDNGLRMRAVLDNIVDGIITIDDQGIIESYNPAITLIFGLEEGDYFGASITQLLDDTSIDQYLTYYDRLHRERFVPEKTIEACELFGIRKDGKNIPIEIAISEMNVEGKNSYIVVVRDITDRKRYEERLIYLANFDALTGLPNRTLFRERLRLAIAHAKRHDLLTAVVFIDLDNFKIVNDTLGHHFGDQLLVSVAKRLHSCVRELDTVARLGGDEFMVIVESINHIEEATLVVTKMLEILDQPFIINDQEIFTTASAGVTIYPIDDTDISNLVKNADTAMFRAKEKGGNTYQYFKIDMNIQVVERVKMESALRHALNRDEFELHYQPKVDLRSNKIVGMEALLRWTHPELGVVSPAKFIPILEDMGLIVAVGEWVLEQACRQTHYWHQSIDSSLCLSVNVSARQFRQNNLVERFINIIKSTHLDASCLELEITEGLLVENVDAAIKVLKAFHNFGIHISIDDFGTGYSSLSYLKRFPLDKLKIDRSFVNDITQNTDDAAIISAIVALARVLGLSVIAEGIETEAQLNFLRKLDCEEAQGYYFSKPLPPDEFAAFITKSKERIVGF